jgi:hypothetical protein
LFTETPAQTVTNNIVIVNKEGGQVQGLLIDWATSISALQETVYEGSLLFAANDVLHRCSMASEGSRVLLVFEKYMDLDSLVKTMFYAKFAELVEPVFELKGKYAATLEFWLRFEQQYVTLSKLLVAARHCNYELLHTLFSI